MTQMEGTQIASNHLDISGLQKLSKDVQEKNSECEIITRNNQAGQKLEEANNKLTNSQNSRNKSQTQQETLKINQSIAKYNQKKSISSQELKDNQISQQRTDEQNKIKTNQKKVQQKINVKMNQMIGQGAFGKIYKYKQYAIKIIDLTKKSVAQIDRFKRECQYMYAASNCDNIVQLYNHKYQKKQNQIYLILKMQLCQTDLSNYIINSPKGRLDQYEALDIFKQILKGCKQLLKLKIIHRDLKPENILIRYLDQHKDTKIVKICDFGASTTLQNVYQDQMNISIGTTYFMSPQMLADKPYTSKTQIWSLGLILYQMLYGISSERFIEYSLIPKFNQKVPISQHTKNMICRMLRIFQKDRPSWDELLQIFIGQNTQNQKLLSNQDVLKCQVSNETSQKTKQEQKEQYIQKVMQNNNSNKTNSHFPSVYSKQSNQTLDQSNNKKQDFSCSQTKFIKFEANYCTAN